MLLHDSTIQVTRDELARSLALPRTAIDALATGGVLSSDERIALRDVERLLQDALLRLYHAEVANRATQPTGEAEEDSITIEAAPDEPQPIITRTIDEFQHDADEGTDARIAPRYMPRRSIGGVFNKTKFTVMQISSTGLRIRHDETLLPGEEARLTFALLQPAQSIIIRARVVWTRVASRGGASFCISGLRVTDHQERLRRALELLREGRLIDLEPVTARRGSTQNEVPAAIHGLSDDDVASILRAARKLADDPIEANRWYARARFSNADPQVRSALPPQTRDRDRILGVWEMLDRKVELTKVAGVLAWTRNARAASL
ncbi:MAG: hypothetical protein QOI24_4225 [Acidobacteriota bacterium]|jgi:Tfp pilus assembly protein PilZ|nr:hypothetical protein [Acidobacteriota bacterium]